MFGFINLNKPVGFTSHDCIAKLRKLLDTRKIGHGGTLDPEATGVLPIAVGKATRLLQFLPESKAYLARIRLGITTTTDDLAGEIVRRVEQIDVSTEEIKDCLHNFRGEIQQVPPAYSAIKKNGKKLYELARQGKEVVIEPRTVTVSRIELSNIDRTDGCELELTIDCGAGTYIRAIARDLGNQLGVGGTLASLIRTASCGMDLENSLTFAQIERQLQQQTLKLIPPQRALNHLNAVTLTETDTRKWCQGQLVDLDRAIAHKSHTLDRNDYLTTHSVNGTFLGISMLYERDNILKIKPKIVCI